MVASRTLIDDRAVLSGDTSSSESSRLPRFFSRLFLRWLSEGSKDRKDFSSISSSVMDSSNFREYSVATEAESEGEIREEAFHLVLHHECHFSRSNLTNIRGGQEDREITNVEKWVFREEWFWVREHLLSSFEWPNRFVYTGINMSGVAATLGVVPAGSAHEHVVKPRISRIPKVPISLCYPLLPLRRGNIFTWGSAFFTHFPS